ncbi:hypothetical protein Rsub_07061 [Raphidocelis subcapitata]|uniref:Alginate lyase domain-containing protein n=1 Tax=Raphidocelis subcapitata TaxID=307507 RepID=A0A2V0PBI2_9CHLO|nr:hypothetical protein Rsub_07061 [Raphidocelis subcapitata]|eukprot:GBF94527.1 hypothetical protein Rsub_07061 [Raphidocelis subcapitata]
MFVGARLCSSHRARAACSRPAVPGAPGALQAAAHSMPPLLLLHSSRLWPALQNPPPALAACQLLLPRPAAASALAQAQAKPQPQACAAAAPSAPPDAFFAALARLRPDDPGWTWNPWDSTPQSEADRASAVRLTCPDFEFVHPGTVAPPELTAALPLVKAKGPAAARASVAALEAWAGPDLGRPAAAAGAVFVAYNPAPHDKARMTPEMIKAFEQLSSEAAAAAAAGAAGHEFSDSEARRALNHTLTWLATGRKAHADKAVEILDAWAGAARSFGPRHANGPLEAAWGLALMARAAELLKHGGAAAWTPRVERRFRGFVETLLLPMLRRYDSYPRAYTAGNEAGTNWAGSIIEARLQYAIFREDLEELEGCARRAAAWLGTYLAADGVTDETVNRDFMHGQFGIAGLVGAASLLYHQTRGAVDLFSYASPLQRAPASASASAAASAPALPPLAAAVELHAAALLGKAPPPLAGAELRYIQSPPTRNDFKDANFEAALHHYTRVKGLQLPNTEAILRQWRPEALVLHWGMGTLTHWGADCARQPGGQGCGDA